MENKVNNQSNYTIETYSDKVQRRNYGKIKRTFDFPNYSDIQTRSYDKFVKEDLEKLVSSFFPIISANEKFQLEFNGLTISDPVRTEEEAELYSKSYESNVYIDISLKDNTTGEIHKIKKSKKSQQKGIFLSTLPRMTKRGTFLINGIEKFVIAQIVRSPGSYILKKTQLKLNNSRRRILEGLICEVLPMKGTMFSIFLQEEKESKKNFIQVILRDVVGSQSVTFPITVFLKGLGYTQEQILNIFNNEDLIVNSLKNEMYNVDEIFNMQEINLIIKDVQHAKSVDELKVKINTADFKIRSAIFNYLTLKKQYDELKKSNKLNDNLSTELKTKMNYYANIVVIERAAQSIVEGLNISQKSLDNLSQKIKNQEDFCFQTILWSHFFSDLTFNISQAGRYKINQKMSLIERLYNQTPTNDILDEQKNVVIQKDAILLRNEVELIQNEIKEGKLNLKNDYKPLFCPKKLADVVINNHVEELKVNIVDNEGNNKVLKLLGTTSNDETINLCMSDILAFISYVISLNYGVGDFDEVDHLGNKRLKLVGELLRTKLTVGMIRVDKFVREKLAIASSANGAEEIEELDEVSKTDPKFNKQITVKSVINTKPFQLIMKEFFNSYQLTQFIDQQNPLSELTNKRRISAMGPGGISREDPNLNIRDVNYSHYGRICPIETPEGMNIGLIMSLASYVRVDENGFLITPYFVVQNGKIVYKEENNKKVPVMKWLDALHESDYVIANASTPVNDEGMITVQNVMARFQAEQKQFPVDKINLIDTNPNQVVSVAASVIPFLENDDANRALMGANMQRQATPLLKPHAPSVGTGNEYKIAHDSNLVIIAEEDGTITEVDGNHIVLKSLDEKRTYNYKLIKYHKSNQNTCFNQTPIVKLNEVVKKDQIIANGPAMQNGELALGQNPLVAFTTFDGYNFEDAIVISERVVNEDLFTSIHIEERIIECLRTKNGDEEITRDIPNVSEDAKRYLDENGIILVGAEVNEGDILVGKISPKGKVELSTEEKLLQSIFGEKVKNVRDASLKVPYGGEGVVIAVHHFNGSDGEFGDDVLEVVKVLIAQKSKIQVGDKMSGRHGNKGIVSRIVKVEDMPHLEDGTPIDILLTPAGVPSRMNMGQVMELHTGISARKIGQQKIIEIAFDDSIKDKAKAIEQVLGIAYEHAAILMQHATKYFKNKYKNLNDALNNYIIDDLLIVFNAAGVSLDDLDYKVATPVFSGIKMNDLVDIMNEAKLDPIKNLGKFPLIDGRTGEYFDAPISVGVMYMLKLDHMVNDKIHARSVGPYSKITQQPLGGKSQNGGQRFGEMEVWALEAYGAAHNLREILTIKSDDVNGRNEAYNAIIKGKKIQNIGLPESFKLLVKQLQGLGMKLDGITKDNKEFDLNNLSSVLNPNQQIEEANQIMEMDDSNAINEDTGTFESDLII